VGCPGFAALLEAFYCLLVYSLCAGKNGMRILFAAPADTLCRI